MLSAAHTVGMLLSLASPHSPVSREVECVTREQCLECHREQLGLDLADHEEPEHKVTCVTWVPTRWPRSFLCLLLHQFQRLRQGQLTPVYFSWGVTVAGDGLTVLTPLTQQGLFPGAGEAVVWTGRGSRGKPAFSSRVHQGTHGKPGELPGAPHPGPLQSCPEW